MRLDQVLVKRGLVATRARARDLILRGQVVVADAPAMKPAQSVGEDTPVAVLGDDARYVSRGALKLIAALKAFEFDCAGLRVLDLGASTGGFTQVVLERGARSVIAVDVGTGQLHASLSNDERVTAHEQTDARRVVPGLVAPGSCQALVCDLSFISILKVLPDVLPALARGAWAVVLVKPQFEVGREAVGKGGVVRDAEQREAAVQRVREFFELAPGWQVVGTAVSPIAGGDGNQETLIGARYAG